MLERIRKVLLTDYIGAIVLAILAADVVTSTIRFVLTPIAFWAGRREYGDVVGYPVSFPWGNLVLPGVTAALNAFVVYLLLRWLYLTKPSSSQAEPEERGKGPQP